MNYTSVLLWILRVIIAHRVLLPELIKYDRTLLNYYCNSDIHDFYYCLNSFFYTYLI